MTETRCPWSDLPHGECHHCHPELRPGDPTKAARQRQAEGLAEPTSRAQVPDILERYASDAATARQHQGAPAKSGSTFCGGPSCSRPTSGGSLCPECAVQLAIAVGEVPWIIEQLRLSYSRQVKFSQKGPTGSSTTQPLVINLASADVAADYAATITTWQARLADHAGQPVRYPDPIAAAMWIAQHERALGTFIDAGKMLADLASTHRTALAVINRPPDKWFTGYCSAPIGEGDEITECPVPLYADAESSIVTCPKCETAHDVEARRRTLLEHADGTLVTASEAARAIVVLSDYERGENLLVKRIGTWAARSRIPQRGHVLEHGRPRPLYRLGDIRALLQDDRATTA